MQNDYDDYEDYESPPFRWMSVGVLLLAVVGFFSLAWYAYYTGTKDTDYQEVATIEADHEPLKVAPEEPGGQEYPHQEKTIYDAPESREANADQAVIAKQPEVPVVPEDMPQKSAPKSEEKVAAIIQKAVEDTQSESGEEEAGADAEEPANVVSHEAKPEVKKTFEKPSKPKVVVKMEKVEKAEKTAGAKPVVTATPNPEHVLKPLPDPFSKSEAAKKEADKATKAAEADAAAAAKVEEPKKAEDKKLEIVKPAMKSQPEEKAEAAKVEPVKVEPVKTEAKPAESKPVDVEVVEESTKEASSAAKEDTKTSESADTKAVEVTAPAESKSEPTKPEPASASGGGVHQLQLGAFRSQEEADSNWSRINKANADVIKGRGHTVVRSDLGEKGVYYRLRMTGFKSAAEAKSLCEQMKAKNLSCFYTTP